MGSSAEVSGIPSAVRRYAVSPAVLCILLLILTAAVYLQVGNHPFLNFDDDTYVTNNLHVAGGLTRESIKWALSSVEGANWHPLTWISHMADVQLYGTDPRGHHLTSVALHTLTTLLLFILLVRMTAAPWQSLFTAALFALHPLHVESVAWVAERKDILCAFFWFLTLLLYSRYAVTRKPGAYLLTLLSFMLGLMSKPMIVTLPLVMLLMDYWPLGRFRAGEGRQELPRYSSRVVSLIVEKLPFFLCSLLSGIVTIYAQNKGGAIAGLTVVPFRLRCENALTAYVTYIGKTLWPHDLAVYYPLPVAIPLWKSVCSLVILILATAAAIRLRRRFPYAITGWFWYLVTLVPVIGFIKMGGQALADRYTYIPVIGLFIIAAWGGADLAGWLKCRHGVSVLISVVIIAASAAMTWHQIRYWRDPVSLYRHTLDVTAGNPIVNYNLGNIYYAQGDYDSAIREYGQALLTAPHNKDVHSNLGLAFARKGNLDAAEQEYQAALLIDPDDADIHNNLGAAHARKGDHGAALRDFRRALQIAPGDADVHFNRGISLQATGDIESAVREYSEALRLDPGNRKARHNLDIAVKMKTMPGK